MTQVAIKLCVHSLAQNYFWFLFKHSKTSGSPFTGNQIAHNGDLPQQEKAQAFICKELILPSKREHRHSDRFPFPSQMAAKRDRHYILSKCLLVASPAAKPTAAESQKWAINNSTDFHLDAKLSSKEDRKPFLTQFAPQKNVFALVSGNWNNFQKGCWCTRGPSPGTVYLHPWPVKGWDLRNMFS